MRIGPWSRNGAIEQQLEHLSSWDPSTRVVLVCRFSLPVARSNPLNAVAKQVLSPAFWIHVVGSGD